MKAADDVDKKDCRVHYTCWCHTGMEVGDDAYQDAILQADLNDDEEFQQILMTISPLRQVFTCRIDVFSWWQGALVLRKLCCNVVSEIEWRAK